MEEQTEDNLYTGRGDFSIRRKSRYFLLSGLLILCLSVPPLFFGLGDLPIRVFDEARNIINAIEMSKSGSLIVSTYHGEPEMWSSKPPFFTWCVAGCIKTFGLSEFSVRLPSAIAGLLTILLVFYYTTRLTGSLTASMCAAMVLLCAEGFAGDHTTRTADYDAMLMLWSFSSAILFFSWSRSKKDVTLYGAFFCLGLAVLTKSAAAFLTVPGIIFYLLMNKDSRAELLSKKFMSASLLLLIPVLGFYLGREALNPGYLKAVWENEFGGRYFVALDAHEHGFWYYAENMIHSRMSIWIWPGLTGFLLIPLIKERETRGLLIFAGMCTASIFLIISTAGTKLFWYDLPMYPWLAISAGLALNKIVLLQAKRRFLLKLNHLKTSLLIILMFIIPYRDLLGRNLQPEEKPEEKEFYALSHYLQGISKDDKRQEDFTLYYTYAEFFYEFYQHLNEPAEFSIVKKPAFSEGERVIHHIPATGSLLDSLYLYECEEKIGDYEKVKIIKLKEAAVSAFRDSNYEP